MKPRFTKTIVATVVNAVPPSPMNLFTAVGDVEGKGRMDIALSGRNGRMVWLENRGRGETWPEHLVGPVEKLERGGLLHDLTGNGLLDVVNGGDWRSDEISWWENPGRRGAPWPRRVIAKTGRMQFHDTLIGRGSGDGVTSLFFTNQIKGTDIYRVPLPADPRVSPWPGLERIASEVVEPNPFRASGIQPEEGLALGDIDGDGHDELVCGTRWYKREGGAWRSHKFAAGYTTTKVAIGDIDGDGRNEIVLAEGDACVYGRREAGGKLGWFKPAGDVTAPWEEHAIADGLLDPHTLALADLCGNGRLDILVGEVGVAVHHAEPGGIAGKLMRVGRRLGLGNGGAGAPEPYDVRLPRLFVFENRGDGTFTPHVIDEGTGIHDGVLVDVMGRGTLDIVGKPLHGPEKWAVHVWFNDTGAPGAPRH